MPNLTSKTRRIAMEAISPNTPISLAIASSFYYKGVVLISSPLSKELIFPTLEFSPTTITTKNPSPVRILVPDRRIGEGIS